MNRKLLVLICFTGIKLFGQVPYFYQQAVGNNLAIDMKEEKDYFSFCIQEFNVWDSAKSYIYHISKSGKSLIIDTFKRNVFNYLEGFETGTNDTLYSYLIHSKKMGRTIPVLDIYKGLNSKSLKLIDSIELPDTLNGLYWKIYRSTDSILYFAYNTVQYGASNFFSINLNSRKIQSIHSPDLQVGPVSITTTFDMKNFILKGINSLQLVQIDNLKSIEYIRDDLFGLTSGQIDKWPGNNLYINTGSQSIDKNILDNIDSLDFGISLIKPDYTFYKNISFGKKKDTSEIPAVAKSLVIGKDYFLVGGTSNFDKFSWPYGYRPSWFLVAKIDTALNTKWVKYYGGDAYYVMMGIDEALDGSILTYGYRYNFTDVTSDLDVYIINLNQYGDVVFTKNIPIKSQTIKVFPNPCRDFIYISIPDNCNLCTFILEDAMGKKFIRKEISGPGVTISVNISSIPPGVYFYSVFVNNHLFQSESIIIN